MCVLFTNHIWIHQCHCMYVIFIKHMDQPMSLHVCSFHKLHMDPLESLHVCYFHKPHMDQLMSLHVCSFHKPHMDPLESLHVCSFPKTTWIHQCHCMCVLFTNHIW